MGYDLILAHTSFLGHTGYAHHSRDFFTKLNKYVSVRVRNFAYTDNLDYLTQEQKDMIIEQKWDYPPYRVGRPYVRNLDHEIVNIVLNETRHYYFYDQYVGPKIAYNVWESTRQPEEFFEKLLEYDMLWVPTTWQRDCSIEQGFPADRVKVVPEGIDTEKFCPGKSEINPYSDNDRFRFIIIGRWDRRKSTTEMIKAFLEEFKSTEPVDLYIHVDNPFGQRMDNMNSTEERLSYYGFIDSRIKILRDLERVENDDLYISYLRNAHCFVSCARAEGWNIPLIHAIAVGTPSIASDYGAQLDFCSEVSHLVNIKEHISSGSMFIQGNNVPGTIAEPDFDHLKEIMRYVYNNYKQCKIEALAGSEIIRNKFTWDNAVKKALSYLDELYEQKKKLFKINLGCGDYKRKGYINIDKYTSADMNMDMLNLTFENNTVDEIYTSQTLEHFSKYEVPKILSECYRVLKVNGILELEVPNLEYCVKKWLEADESDKWGFRLDTIFGLQTHEGEFHKTGFTKERLEYLLNEAGFYVQGIRDIWSHDQSCFFVRAVKKVEPFKQQDKTRYIKINYNFLDGAFLEILGTGNSKFEVEFVNLDNNKIVYSTTLTPNHWARPDFKYYVNWSIKVQDSEKKLIFEHSLDLKDQRVFINIDSKALGDTLAWFPYVEEFRKRHNCNVIVSTFWNELFEESYPEIEFVKPGEVVHNLYAQYKIGAFDSDLSRNKINWRVIPLQRVASDILGLEYKEIRPLLVEKIKELEIQDDYVVITQHSTFQAKYWMYPNGWQILVDYLKDLGYKVVVVSTQPPVGVKDVIDKTGQNRSIFETMNIIKHAKAFVGISTGPTWLAWALNIPTILVSGYSTEWAEMSDCVRILNKNECYGCFNDPSLPIDRGDWNWCPRHNNFKCSTSITPDMIIEHLDRILK